MDRVNTLDEIIKWSMPGWIFSLHIVTFAVLIELAVPAETFILVTDGNITGSVMLIGALAGIPIGFLIYQWTHIFFRIVPLYTHRNHEGELEQDMQKKLQRYISEKNKRFSNKELIPYEEFEERIKFEELENLHNEWDEKIEDRFLIRVIRNVFVRIFVRKSEIEKGLTYADAAKKLQKKRRDVIHEWKEVRSTWTKYVVNSECKNVGNYLGTFKLWHSIHNQLGSSYFSVIFAFLIALAYALLLSLHLHGLCITVLLLTAFLLLLLITYWFVALLYDGWQIRKRESLKGKNRFAKLAIALTISLAAIGVFTFSSLELSIALPFLNVHLEEFRLLFVLGFITLYFQIIIAIIGICRSAAKNRLLGHMYSAFFELNNVK